jgi:HipA-like protein
MLNNSKIIIGVDVYLEKRKTREYVGRLSRINKKYLFTYDDLYIYKDRSIAIGPDLPLTTKKSTSNKLFPSFDDRIPSKRNPAYSEYCEMVGINPTENDPLILVATLGQKGPSSFIFAPVYEETINSSDLIEFRKFLQLSMREFSELFDLSTSTIFKIEKNQISGKESLKRLEIYLNFPQVAIFEVKRNGHKINDKKRKKVEELLEKTQKNSGKKF